MSDFAKDFQISKLYIFADMGCNQGLASKTKI